jgi:hypothetical protein
MGHNEAGGGSKQTAISPCPTHNFRSVMIMTALLSRFARHAVVTS